MVVSFYVRITLGVVRRGEVFLDGNDAANILKEL